MEHYDPGVESAMFQGVEAMKLQQFEQAFGHFSQLIKLAPDYAEGWNKRATVLYLMGRFKESEADVMRTLELEPRHFGALSGQGLIRIALQDWTGAIFFLESALKINPHMYGVIMQGDQVKNETCSHICEKLASVFVLFPFTVCICICRSK